MKNLSPDRVAKYKSRLNELQWALTREYWKEREASLDQDFDQPGDLIDLAVKSYSRDFLLSLSERERKELFLIEDALARLDAGDYGICSHCGSKIPRSRLNAVPWARLCIVCQGLQEDGLLPTLTFSPRAA